MLENYSPVRLLTDRFRSEGAAEGDLGYVIETYPDGVCEVEFSNPQGITFAQIVARENELQRDEPTLPIQDMSSSDTVHFDRTAANTAKKSKVS